MDLLDVRPHYHQQLQMRDVRNQSGATQTVAYYEQKGKRFVETDNRKLLLGTAVAPKQLLRLHAIIFY